MISCRLAPTCSAARLWHRELGDSGARRRQRGAHRELARLHVQAGASKDIVVGELDDVATQVGGAISSRLCTTFAPCVPLTASSCASPRW